MNQDSSRRDINAPVLVSTVFDITVNGEQISESEVGAEMQYHPAASKQQAFQLAARALIVRSLLLQRAVQLGFQADSAEHAETADETTIKLLLEKEVITPQADDQACRKYFDSNRDKFKTSDLVEASHILIPAAPDDVKGRRKAREQVDELFIQLNNGMAFDALAEAYSVCPSKQDGGHLGQLSRGQTVDEFERQVFALVETGIANQPIESRYGFHIVRIDQRAEGQLLDFDTVKQRIVSYLQDRVRHKAISQYIAFLAGEAEIKGFDMDVSDSPLLQ
jgi:peptidyl-prolyl cis-trans isomerase C